jgi:hypothetical protein
VRHVAEKLFEGTAVFAADAEVMQDLFVSGDVARLLRDVVENFLFGDHGMTEFGN